MADRNADNERTVRLDRDRDPDRTVRLGRKRDPDRTVRLDQAGDPERTVRLGQSRDPERTVRLYQKRDPDRTVRLAQSSDPERTVRLDRSRDPERTNALDESEDDFDALSGIDKTSVLDPVRDFESTGGAEQTRRLRQTSGSGPTRRLGQPGGLDKTTRLERVDATDGDSADAPKIRTRIWTGRSIVLTALLFFVAWLPYLIVMYPGAIGYDEAWAILQTMGSGSMSLTTGAEAFAGHFAVDHKPIMHTLILGFFCDLGDRAFGSQNLGVFLLVIIQSAFMALVASAVAWYVRVLSGRAALVIAIVFFALFPGIPLYLSSPSNDALFTPFFLLWILMVVVIVRMRGSSERRGAAFWILFAIAGIGCVLFKKTGIYLVVATFVILLLFGFVFRRRRSPRRLTNGSCAGLCGMFVATCAAYCAVVLVVCPLLDVIPGGRQEMLAPILHMTAAYSVEYPDDSTVDERAVIDEVLDYDQLPDMYEDGDQDPVKHCYRQDATWSDIGRYLGVWASQGMRHPDVYLHAWWSVVSGYVSRLVPIDYLDNAELGNAATSAESVMEDHAGFPQTYDVSYKITLASPDWALRAQDSLRAGIEALEDSPLIILLCSAVYAFWIPLLSLICAGVRRRGILIAYVPFVLSVLLVFISPIVTFRYVLPLAAAAPLLIGMAFARKGGGHMAHEEGEPQLDKDVTIARGADMTGATSQASGDAWFSAWDDDL